MNLQEKDGGHMTDCERTVRTSFSVIHNRPHLCYPTTNNRNKGLGRVMLTEQATLSSGRSRHSRVRGKKNS